VLQRASFDTDAAHSSSLAANDSDDSERVIGRLVAMSDDNDTYSYEAMKRTLPKQGFRTTLSVKV
jgi:hypothetical protein